ncbi:MAG: thioredoxin domain-containing protein [Prolixibacteraceae bacterium]|jgi:thioredoxin 1|nr:thioredoxin domain-containing protein [Prolixibacteraceae bacterium]
MNRNYLIISSLLALISFTAKAQQVNQINAVEFQKIVSSKKGTLLDVRTKGEFASGHIEGAGQLNYYALNFRQKLLLLPTDQPIFLYCNTGYRSKRATGILAENGYKQMYNLEQGIMDWNLNNLPVVVEPGAKQDVENKMEPDEYYALIQSDKPVFIDFYAPWCGPCCQMMPMIDSLKTEYKDRITIVKINADASKKLLKELKLSTVPNLVIYKDGRMVFNHNGLVTEELLISEFKKL